MSKDMLILKEGTVIELETGASLSALGVLSADKAAMVATWDKFTPDNLSAVQIKNGDGLTVGNYMALILVAETSITNEDGTILTYFRLREKTDMEKNLDNVTAQTEKNSADIDYILMMTEV
ncbi:hypothetical protein [Kineothrix sedimenti]|uniref:Uncharacterized protein n=1 Tax=Kineothrix sedimenti TaxID=3123317 RepID=A0ABZ3ESB6_9FIRM